MKVDINCDMGESFGAYKLGLDEEVIKHITSANIACGYHAGDPIDGTDDLLGEESQCLGGCSPRISRSRGIWTPINGINPSGGEK